MLRPIEMHAPDRTVVMWQRDDTRGTPVVEAAHGEVDAWRRNATSLEALGAFSSVNWSLTLVDGESRSRVAYAAVSAPFFEVVGIGPALGVLSTTAMRSGTSHALPSSATSYGDDASVRARKSSAGVIRVQEDVESPVRSLEVVGVMPPEFDFPRGAQLWIPAAPSLRAFAQRAGQDAGEFWRTSACSTPLAGCVRMRWSPGDRGAHPIARRPGRQSSAGGVSASWSRRSYLSPGPGAACVVDDARWSAADGASRLQQRRWSAGLPRRQSETTRSRSMWRLAQSGRRLIARAVLEA